jgi:hypothetical protein
MADDDESTAESQDATSSSGDENQPAPAGETGPDSSSGGSSDDENKPIEDNEGHSDSSAETDGSDSSSSESDSSSDSSSDKSSSSDSSSDDSSSSSSDSSEPNQSVQPPSESDVADALTKAFRARDVPMWDDVVSVTLSSGLYRISARLSADFQPLSQVPEDASKSPGSITGAMYMINGAVQLIDNATKVTMRVVSVATSEILESGEGNASGGAALDIIEAAAEDALAGLPSLGAR